MKSKYSLIGLSLVAVVVTATTVWLDFGGNAKSTTAMSTSFTTDVKVESEKYKKLFQFK